MQRELALEIVRVTEAAAIASGRYMGRGDTDGADQAAVDAMRRMLDTVEMCGTVVIGEGEMDDAPMLYIGERVGTGTGEPVDVAVDPVEGTNLVAKGLPGALAVMAVAPAGHLLHAPDLYMEKLVVGPRARGRVALDRPMAETIRAVAAALQRTPSEVTVVVLDRPRHAALIAEIRAAGARIKLISDGDVAPAIAACVDGSGVDLLVGIGGAPEGVLAAAAVKCLGGEMWARLRPQDDAERDRVRRMGVDPPDRVLGLEDLVRGDDVLFVATGITDSDLVPGVRYQGAVTTTHSLVMRGRTGTVRWVRAEHRWDQKIRYGKRPKHEEAL